jgi:hypothetical protein
VKPSDAKLDQTILSVSLPQWRKVALILAKSHRQLEDEGTRTSLEDLAARIEFLVREGRLEAQGDLLEWRYSEVRMPSATSTPPRPSTGRG